LALKEYEIEAEYDDPRDIPFKKNCIYCFNPANSEIQIEEQSKISNILSKPFFPVFFLFVVYSFILGPLMTNQSITAPALFLASLTWAFFSFFVKKNLKTLFRYAQAFICSDCFTKWKKRQSIHSLYWSMIFACFLLLVILSIRYTSKELKSSDLATSVFAVCIFGVLLQSWVLGLIESFFKLKLKVPFSLMKQGLIRGVSKIKMPEEAFSKLVDEKVDVEDSQ
jgi:hypothetical protein